MIYQCLDKWINAGLLCQVLLKKREHRSVLVKDMQWILYWTGWPKRCNCTLNTCFCWGAERWHSQGQSWLLLISNKYKTDLPPLLLFSAKKMTCCHELFIFLGTFQLSTDIPLAQNARNISPHLDCDTLYLCFLSPCSYHVHFSGSSLGGSGKNPNIYLFPQSYL